MDLTAANDNQPVRYGPWVPTAALARELHCNTYFTGKPCLRGHVAPRARDSHNCVACRHEDQVARKATAAGREAVKAYAREYARDRRANDPDWKDRQLELDRISSKKPERKAKKQARKTDRLATDADYRERVNTMQRPHRIAWKKANPEAVAVMQRNRRAKVRGAEGMHTAEDIRRIHAEQDFKCAICGVSTLEVRHVDHIVPLSRGGSNWPSNLQILCPLCNDRKGAKTMEEYMAHIGANDNLKPAVAA